MKISKILGCVLSLHLGVIALLLVQPGCQTGQPPTQTHTQDRTQMRAQAQPQSRSQDFTVRTNVEGASRSSTELIPATQLGEGQGLDAAFNAGFESEPLDFEPIDSYEPIAPLESLSTAPSVPVQGAGYESYTVKKGDSLWAIAKRYDVSLNELYAANGLNKNSVIRVGQQIQIPSQGGSASVRVSTADTYQPSGFDQATTSYTVQRGDNLSKIANRYNTTVAALKAANGKSSDIIRVGEVLTVPANGGATGVSAPSASVSAPSVSTGATRTHTVKAGEFPGKIARQYGMTTAELLSINNISDPRKLRVGQELIVSGSGSAQNVASRVETRSTASTSATTAAPVTITPARPVTTTSTTPGAIRVVEADPIIEGEMDEPEAEPLSDDIFEDAIEIPVIRLEN
ncbi:MAG: LysM peptidoglycan-binding domain-containing protein [Opitutales bacterium]